MEGKPRARDRRLKRCYQCKRLEDQLWAMAYEHVWPVVRRAWCEEEGERDRFEREDATSASSLARRA
jgi:hypothetical protein